MSTLILLGILWGLVTSALLQVYIQFGVNTKRPAVAFLWLFYIFAVVLGSGLAWPYVVPHWATLTPQQRGQFGLACAIIVLVTSVLSGIRVDRQRRAKKQKEEQTPS
jgi:uncharacterized membrane protein